MLREVSQTEKDEYSYVCVVVGKRTNRKTSSQIQRTDQWLPEVEVRR